MSLRRRVVNYSGAAPKVTFAGVHTAGVVNTSGTHTHPVAFGAADSSRYLVAVVGYQNGTGGTVTSCTIGGVAASKVVGINSSGSYCEIWIAAVPTGTSGNVVISGPSGNWTSGCAVYSILYLASSTAFATATSIAAPVSLSLNVPGPGVVIAATWDSSFGSVGSGSWSGITSDFSQAYGAGSNTGLSGASGNYASSASLSLTGSWSFMTFIAGVAASFR